MKNQTILLVEDNPRDQQLALRALDKIGRPFRLVVAHDGVDALDYLFGTGAYGDGRAPDLPAAVLMDLQLPKVDGFEVLRRMRADARTALLPVIILTSSSEEEDIRRGYRLGANSYLRKPIDFTRFIGIVEQFGLYWLDLNEPPPR
jgi:two-component system response regulator